MEKKKVSLPNGLDFTYFTTENYLFIDVKGSNSRKDYIKNLMAWPRVKYGMRKYHREWLKSALELRDWVNSLDFSPFTIDIHGHSMGGAVAAIFGELFTGRVNVTTWNSPKCGAKNVHVASSNHRSDIVHYLPLLYPKYRGVTYKYGKKCIPFWKAHVMSPGDYY